MKSQDYSAQEFSARYRQPDFSSGSQHAAGLGLPDLRANAPERIYEVKPTFVPEKQMGGRILLGEADAEYAEELSSILTAEGFETQIVTDGRQVPLHWETWRPDAIILGLHMPHLDGLSLTSLIRQTSSVPIILVSESAAPAERAIGLRFGADDYLTRPIDADELLERIRAILRRVVPHSAERPATFLPEWPGHDITVGNLRLDLAEPLVAIGGEPVVLTPTELRLLAGLAEHAGRVVSRAQLWRTIASGSSPLRGRVLDSHVWRLREKLRVVPAAPTIETVRGLGYRLRPNLGGGPEPNA